MPVKKYSIPCWGYSLIPAHRVGGDPALVPRVNEKPSQSGRVTLLVLVAVGLTAALSACSGPRRQEPPGASEGAISVWVSIIPQKYFVERVGGDRVDVEVMVPPGFSPATYEPRPSQIESLAGADMYVRIGVPFEDAWMSRIRASNQVMLLVDQSHGIDRIDGRDPHIWLSPRLVKVQVRTVCDALVELDPAHEGLYRANLEVFLADLEELDARIERELSGLKTRSFIVFHPAWAYFAADYSLEMIPVQVEGDAPSAAEMADLIRIARASGIKVIFAQPEFSTQSAETIAREIDGRVLLISPLALDWMDNLFRVADTFAEVLDTQGQ
jgi:zinc transport system substrate-binding protein